MEPLEPVLDGGLGATGDLAPESLPVRPESAADDAHPSPCAPPVTFAIAAWGIAFVLEEDAVLAPASACAHTLHDSSGREPI